MQRSLLGRMIDRPEFGPFVLLVLLIVVFSAINPAFISLANVGNLLAFTVELGLIALAMTLLMTCGEFDLSVGSVFGFAPVIMWTLFNTGIMPLPAAFAVALLIALAIGLFTGIFVTVLNIPSFCSSYAARRSGSPTAFPSAPGMPGRSGFPNSLSATSTSAPAYRFLRRIAAACASTCRSSGSSFSSSSATTS